MNKVLLPIYAKNLDESIDFYCNQLSFSVFRDETYGHGFRSVILQHPKLESAYVALKPYLASDVSWRDDKTILHGTFAGKSNAPLFHLVLEWTDLSSIIESPNVRVVEKIEAPYGVWIYVIDPSDNVLCFTTFDGW